ncbi:MAG: YkgJ family cysteine cluster protein [Myxococcota bacterium]
MTQKRQGVLSEETVRLPTATNDDGSQEETINPYWLAEEPEPHPNPELGCIRRGLCCKSSPGRFAPGELEKAAASLHMEPEAFVRAFVVIDRIDLDGDEVEVFVPVKVGVDHKPMYPTAQRVDRLYQMLRGACIFYADGGCQIYNARPLECQRYICTNAPADNLSPQTLARMWRDGTPAPEKNDTSTTAPELHPLSEEQATPQLGTPLSDTLPDNHGL